MASCTDRGCICDTHYRTQIWFALNVAKDEMRLFRSRHGIEQRAGPALVFFEGCTIKGGVLRLPGGTEIPLPDGTDTADDILATHQRHGLRGGGAVHIVDVADEAGKVTRRTGRGRGHQHRQHDAAGQPRLHLFDLFRLWGTGTTRDPSVVLVPGVRHVHQRGCARLAQHKRKRHPGLYRSARDVAYGGRDSRHKTPEDAIGVFLDSTSADGSVTNKYAQATQMVTQAYKSQADPVFVTRLELISDECCCPPRGH